jgi:hypothetical protein
VRLDRFLFDVHQLCKVTLPLNCNAFPHCSLDIYFCFQFFLSFEIKTWRALMQVHSLRLDVFCRPGESFSIPRSGPFLPLDVELNSASTNFIALTRSLAGKMESNSLLGGGQRISIGFMQTIMELLTSPGDIVLNWAVGEGCTYRAGELSNWFVAGMKSRPTFYSLAQHQLVLKPPTLRNKKVEDVGGSLSKPISVYDESDSEHEGQRRCR